MTALSSFILLALAALAFVFVFLVARHFPLPATTSATETAAAPDHSVLGPPPTRSQRRRARAVLAGSFDQMLAFLRSMVAGRRFAYAVPWYLVIGESGAGKTALLDSLERSAASGLEPPEGLARQGLGAWRFFEGGVVLDVDVAPGRRPGGVAADEGGWQELLRLLRNYRPLRPIDGVVLVVSCDDLVGSDPSSRDALAAKAGDFYRRLRDLQQHFGLRLPVYLVLTKSDRIPGFASVARELAPLHGREILGWSMPGEPDSPLTPRLATGVFADVAARLRTIHLDIAADSDAPIDADGMFVCSGAVRRLAGSVQLLLDSLFRPSAYHDPFFLRGIYLTGGIAAAGHAAGAAPETDARAAAALHTPIFVRDLFTQKIFAEHALAAAARHGPVHRSRNVRLLQAGLAVFAVVAVAGLTFEVTRLERGIATFLPALRDIDQGLASISQTPPPAGGTAVPNRFAGAETFLTGLANIDLTSLWSPFLPSSWFSNPQNRAVDYLEVGFTQVLLPTIRRELADEVQAAVAGSGLPAADTAPSNRPYALAGSSDFRLLDAYVQKLTALRAEAALFNQLNDRPELSLIDRLSNELLGIKVAAGFYRKSKLYERALSLSRVEPYDFTPIIPRAREKALALYQPIEERFSANGPIVTPFVEVANGFANLEGARQAGTDPGAAADALVAALVKTQRMLADPDLAWITSAGANDIPEFRRLFETMSSSPPVFGPELATKLLDRTEAGLRGLQKQLAALSAPSIGPILDQANGRPNLKFAPPVAQVAQRLPAILKYSFMAQPTATSPTLDQIPRRGVRWDADTLGTALAYYRDYEQFRINDLAALPKALVKPIDAFALRRLQASMVRAVVDAASAGANDAAPDEGAVFDRAARFQRAGPVLGDILTVFNQLGFAAPYDRLRALATGQAYALLRQVDQLAEPERLYLPQRDLASWAGESTALEAGFQLRSDVEVAQYLDGERERVARLAGAAEPALNFLGRSDIAGLAAMPLVGKWRGIVIALRKYQAGDPGGSVASLENFIRFDLARADRGNCPIRSGAALAADFFGQRQEMLARQLALGCRNLAAATTVFEYDRIAAMFNAVLAGRYPFAPAGAAPAELAGIAEFFGTFAAAEAAVRANVDNSGLPGTQRATQFLDALDKVGAFFAPLLAPPTGERSSGYDLKVAFRVNRRYEHGADQIIDWTMNVGDTVLRNDNPTARWFVGDPITIRLRWAKDSPLTPYAVAGGPQIDGLTAIFKFNGPWALIRLLRQHLAAPVEVDPGSADAVPHLLKFVVPTSVPSVEGAIPVGPENQVTAYIRISLTAPGATGPAAAAIILPDFPERAPELSGSRSVQLHPEHPPKRSGMVKRR